MSPEWLEKTLRVSSPAWAAGWGGWVILLQWQCWEWDRWLIVSIDCGEGAGPTQWRRKVERFPSFYVPCLASRRPDKSCLIAVFVWNLTWENGPSGGSAQDKWLADNMSGQHFLKDASVGIKDFWSWKRNCLGDISTEGWSMHTYPDWRWG